VECRLYPEQGNAQPVDLGRNWEVLTFLFSGSKEPKGKPETLLVELWPDIGGGEASSVDAQSIAHFADWLDSHDDGQLISRFDSGAMIAARVYRSHVIEGAPDVVRDEVVAQLAELRRFADQCRAEHIGAIIVIC